MLRAMMIAQNDSPRWVFCGATSLPSNPDWGVIGALIAKGLGSRSIEFIGTSWSNFFQWERGRLKKSLAALRNYRFCILGDIWFRLCFRDRTRSDSDQCPHGGLAAGGRILCALRILWRFWLNWVRNRSRSAQAPRHGMWLAEATEGRLRLERHYWKSNRRSLPGTELVPAAWRSPQRGSTIGSYLVDTYYVQHSLGRMTGR